MNSSPPRVFLLNVFEKAPTGNARNVVHWLLRHSLEPGKWSSRMNVETIRALWRGVDTARAGQFEDAVKWFDRRSRVVRAVSSTVCGRDGVYGPTKAIPLGCIN